MRDESTTSQGRKREPGQLLAKLRQRQLDLARRGKIAESATYARRASRIRGLARRGVAA